MTPERKVELLLKTREVLAGHWTQGQYYNRVTDCYCLVGALRKAVWGTPYSHEVNSYVAGTVYLERKEVQDELIVGLGRTSHFEENVLVSRPPRATEQQVLDHLDRTIARLRA